MAVFIFAQALKKNPYYYFPKPTERYLLKKLFRKEEIKIRVKKLNFQ